MIAHTEAQTGRPLHSVEEIRDAYDAQAEESYQKKLWNPFFERYGRAVGRTLASLEPESILDAGCGDGVTLRWACEEFNAGTPVAGFDISPKRTEIARRILPSRYNILGNLSMFHLPFLSNIADVVFTSHALEPNGGREVDAIRELYRVAQRYLVLFEPDYDAAPIAGKLRMERLNYVTQIPKAIRTLGLNCVRYEPFSEIGNPLNPTSLWVIRKEAT